MKLKGTHLFYLFVILLVGSVYYFDYYRGEEDKKVKDQAAILLPLDQKDIQRIELKNSAGELELVRAAEGDDAKAGEANTSEAKTSDVMTGDATDSAWRLVRPLADQASSSEVADWIQSLVTEKSLEKIGEGETFEWSLYGLDQPAGTLVVHTRSGETATLSLSSKRNFEGNPFLKKNGEAVVYVGSSMWNGLLSKAAKEFREKKLLRKNLTKLEGFTLILGPETLELKVAEGQWSAPRYPQWRLDQNKVREIVNVVQEMRATDFVVETDPDAKQKTTYGLAPQAPVKVRYHMKDGATWEIEFGQDSAKTAWYAWPRDLKKVVKVESSQVEKLRNTKMLDFRDREEPFVFNTDSVHRLALTEGSQHVELSKEGEEWKSSSPGSVEKEEVRQFMDRLRQLRVGDFFDPDSKRTTGGRGLDRPTRQFVLADRDGKNIFELKIGQSYKVKEPKPEKIYYFAQSSLFKGDFGLNEDDVKGLEIKKLIPSSEAQGEAQGETPSGGSAPDKADLKSNPAPTAKSP